MISHMSLRYYLLLSAAILWILLILAAPWASLENPRAGKYLYLFFSGTCHQEAERCFQYQGLPLAVCARCLGLHLGFVLGLIGSAMLTGFRKKLLSRPRILLFFLLPMAVDLLLPNNHWSRLITGMTASFPVAFFVHLAVEQIQFNSLRRTTS